MCVGEAVREQIFDKMCEGPMYGVSRRRSVRADFRQDVRGAPFTVYFGAKVCEQISDNMCEGPHFWCVSEKQCVSRFPTRCVRGPIMDLFVFVCDFHCFSYASLTECVNVLFSF